MSIQDLLHLEAEYLYSVCTILSYNKDDKLDLVRFIWGII